MKTKSKAVYGRLNIAKANRLYGDVVTGIWEDTSYEGGSWSSDDGEVDNGLFKKKEGTNIADLYLDINYSGVVDDGDMLVGYAQVAPMDTGGYGRWSWSYGAGIGDYFTSNGQDAGKFFLADPSVF